MNVLKCDRCGTYYDEEVDIDNQPFIVRRYDTLRGGFVLADLCKPCYNELNKFMRNDTYCFHENVEEENRDD